MAGFVKRCWWVPIATAVGLLVIAPLLTGGGGLCAPTLDGGFGIGLAPRR